VCAASASQPGRLQLPLTGFASDGAQMKNGVTFGERDQRRRRCRQQINLSIPTPTSPIPPDQDQPAEHVNDKTRSTRAT
jgi:hypothetical protein